MKKSNVRVSIGLPIYNGEKFIQETLESILSQSFTNFELIISDNKSTDKTEEFCRKYAAKDRRIRYYRNDVNRGAAWNYNRVFQLSIGEYFKWAAHDDLISFCFLSKCIEVLEADPSIVLCYTKAKVLDERGIILEDYREELNLSSEKTNQRFHDLLFKNTRNYHIFGLIRHQAIRQTNLIGGYAGSNKVFLAQLSLLGRFYEIPEPLFFSRRHLHQSSSLFNQNYEHLYYPKTKSQIIYSFYKIRHRLTKYHQYESWFNPNQAGKLVFPNWNILKNYFICLNSTPLHFDDKTICHLHLLFWSLKPKILIKLLTDITISPIMTFNLGYNKLIKNFLIKAP